MNNNLSISFAVEQTTGHYATSAPIQNNWMQPNLAEIYNQIEVASLIDNLYAVIRPNEDLVEEFSSDAEFMAELAAWDAASDEALLNFERSLDDEEG